MQAESWIQSLAKRNMAKSRRNRASKAHRSDPIAPKTVKPPSDPELAALRETRILPVLKDLRSPEPKSRTAAASVIANIVEDTKCRKLLLREQVVHTVLTETLTDTSLDSRAAGWQILKVLAREEDSDFCVHLFRLDVLTAIQHAAKAVSVSHILIHGTSRVKETQADNLCPLHACWRLLRSHIYIYITN